jgi:hypothetical protein
MAGAPVHAATATAASDAAGELAAKYVPIVKLKQQAEPCDEGGEAYGPSSVTPILGNPDFTFLKDGVAVMRGPTAQDLYEKPEGYAIDYPGSPLSAGCDYDELARSLGMGVPPKAPTAYAHVTTQADEPGLLVVQYWFFYLFNDYNNLHEGDWEMAQLVFRADTPEEALTRAPVEMGLSQHNLGEKASWTDPKVEKQGDHPVVYAAKGSHAGFYGPGLWLERSPSEGIGCDDTRGPSVTVAPKSVLLPSADPGRDSPLAWITYKGTWGEQLRAPYDGPPGPNTTDRWANPVTWQNEARDSSTPIPDVGSDIVTASFCNIVAAASQLLTDLGSNPVVTLSFLLGLLAIALFLVRRTRWNRVPIDPVVRDRRAGQMIRSALALMRRSPMHTLAVGLVFIPIAVVASGIQWLVSNAPVIGPVLQELGGEASLVWIGAITFAVPGGVIGYIAAIFLVSAGMEIRDRTGRNPSARELLHEARVRLRATARSVALRALQIVALAVSIVGIPWAAKLLVETQVLTQVCVVEDRTGEDSRMRARALVRGAWVRVAVISLLASMLPLLVAPLLAMPFLLLQMPVSVVNLIGAVFAAAVTPLAAVVMVLLYGDRVAEGLDSAPPPARIGP